MEFKNIQIIWDYDNGGWYLRYDTQQQTGLDSRRYMPEDLVLTREELLEYAVMEINWLGGIVPPLDEIGIVQ
jgi:hypothetical protein